MPFYKDFKEVSDEEPKAVAEKAGYKGGGDLVYVQLTQQKVSLMLCDIAR